MTPFRILNRLLKIMAFSGTVSCMGLFADYFIILSSEFYEMKNRIEKEKHTVGLMVRLYCRRFEGNRTLCPDCRELLAYAEARLDACRFGDGKPTCRKCPIHCYRPDMREKMRVVMRWAGPRMMLYHPVEAVRHLMRERLK